MAAYLVDNLSFRNKSNLELCFMSIHQRILSTLASVSGNVFDAQFAVAILLSVGLIGTAAAADNPDDPVTRASDFTLIDQHGKAFNLHYHEQVPAIVLMGHRNGSTHVSAAIADISEQWSEQGVVFALINPAPGESRADILADTQQHELDMPVLKDEAGLVAETLALNHAAETLIIEPGRWQIVYRGPAATDAFSTTLQALLADESVALTEQAMPADAELLPQHAAAAELPDAMYSDTIAPLLVEKCADCHRPGGIGPWAMTNHAMIQGFSPMIRETILTKRMPPWHADPEIGEFLHDLSLSVDEARQLVSWIDAGAPRGEGEDKLMSVVEQAEQWELGEPDLVVTLPKFDIPATGTLDYQFFEVKNPLDRDVWVRAIQIAPGDRQVVHHAIATFGASSNEAGQSNSSESLFQPQLMTFVPGNETYEYPENTGVYVPAGSSFYTQMHYTTYGRATSDETRIGLYFRDEAPEHVLQHYSIVNPELRIPQGVAEHEETAYYQFQRDAVIYSLFPHAHYRGRSSEFTIRYPDGREEVVLSVPNYDFNWQRYFQFQEPIEAPAGTFVIHRTVYDNSTANLSNPDPSVTVRFGEQTWEEMLYGGISFRYEEPSENDHEINEDDYMAALAMGFMDVNIDGKIALDEMPEQSRQQLALPFTIMDRNKTMGLEYPEFRSFMVQSNMLSRDAF